jgi:hypothetical protein
MPQETIQKIKDIIENNSSLPPEKKKELLAMIAELKEEMSHLDHDDARSIIGFAEMSAHEATKARGNEKLKALSLDGLRASIESFEVSHPKLTAVVNNIANSLSNMGI